MFERILIGLATRLVEWLGKSLAKEIRRLLIKAAENKADEKDLAKMNLAKNKREKIEAARDILSGI